MSDVQAKPVHPELARVLTIGISAIEALLRERDELRAELASIRRALIGGEHNDAQAVEETTEDRERVARDYDRQCEEYKATLEGEIAAMERHRAAKRREAP